VGASDLAQLAQLLTQPAHLTHLTHLPQPMQNMRPSTRQLTLGMKPQQFGLR
jgi:hypothetical protein